MIASGIGSLSIALASVGGIAGVAAGAVGFLGSALGKTTPTAVATAVKARTIPPVIAIAFCTGPGNALNLYLLR
jgi:hypothetical protein